MTSPIGIIGAGTMGTGIAQVAAMAGHQVIISDTNTGMLEKAKQGLEKTFSMLAEKGKLKEEESNRLLAAISYSSSLEGFRDCNFVIEAVIENLEVKQELFSELEKIVSPSCILATNTSSLSVTSVAAACKTPQRVIGIHFFNPAPLLPLVEIIKGLETALTAEEQSKKLISSWGKVPVLAKDAPGFIVNRIARPFYGEAIRIYEEGLGNFSFIDEAMRSYGFRMGPFELMDLIGNDVNYTVTETVWKQFFYDPRYKPSLTQKRLFEAKRFGKKSGQGYYSYNNGVKNQDVPAAKVSSETIFLRIISMLINEAADALYLDIASLENIELAMTKGVNYPKGLLKWCDELGAGKIFQTLNSLHTEYGEERYRSSVLLRQMAKNNKKFYS